MENRDGERVARRRSFRYLTLGLTMVGALVLGGCVTPDTVWSLQPTSAPRVDGSLVVGAAPATSPPSATTGVRAIPRGTPGSSAVVESCGAARAMPIVADFLAAFNRGDQAALAQFFPEQGFDPADPRNVNRLEVFSLDAANPSAGIDHLILHTRPTLLAYFAERQRQHEQIRLLDLRPTDQGLTVGFGFTLSRQADDLATRTFPGKGVINCAHGTIIVWNQGRIVPSAPASATP